MGGLGGGSVRGRWRREREGPFSPSPLFPAVAHLPLPPPVLAYAHLATSRALLDALPRVDLDLAGGRDGGLRLHPGLDVSRHGEEGLLNVGRSLGGRFQKVNAERFRKLPSLICRYDPLGRQVGLVTHQELVDVLASVSINLVQPLLHVVEGLVIGNVVYYDDAVSATIIRGGDGTESLLSRSVPDL